MNIGDTLILRYGPTSALVYGGGTGDAAGGAAGRALKCIICVIRNV